jgi:hypothetical protein
MLLALFSLRFKYAPIKNFFYPIMQKQTKYSYIKMKYFSNLLNSMVDKDAKVREMRRENLLLTSKIQLLEDQMENLNDRVDRTLRERNQLRREVNSVRFDSNLSIEVIFYLKKNDKFNKICFFRQVLVLPQVHLLLEQRLISNLQHGINPFIIQNHLVFIMVIIIMKPQPFLKFLSFSGFKYSEKINRVFVFYFVRYISFSFFF